MKYAKVLCAIALPFLCLANSANADVIDFEELSSGTIGANHYASQGLILDGTYSIYTNQDPGVNGSGSKSIHQSYNHFGGTFVNTVSSISVLMGDWCCDYDTGVLSVYDAANNLIGTSNNAGNAWFSISSTAAGIKSFSINGTGAVLFDKIEFTVSSVPEPGPLALLGLGLLMIRLGRKKSPI